MAKATDTNTDTDKPVEDSASTPGPKDRITMTHPAVDGSAVTTRKAFEKVWKDKGWVEAK